MTLNSFGMFSSLKQIFTKSLFSEYLNLLQGIQIVSLSMSGQLQQTEGKQFLAKPGYNSACILKQIFHGQKKNSSHQM